MIDPNNKKKTETTEEEEDTFIESAVIGGLTNSTGLGILIGGDVAGAILGDILNDGDIDIF
jgi:hypothetical protein